MDYYILVRQSALSPRPILCTKFDNPSPSKPDAWIFRSVFFQK